MKLYITHVCHGKVPSLKCVLVVKLSPCDFPFRKDKQKLSPFLEAMARTRCWGQGGFLLTSESKESVNQGFAGASEQSPETVKKLTFALLDKIFESRPSLLAELKNRAEKEVKI